MKIDFGWLYPTYQHPNDFHLRYTQYFFCVCIHASKILHAALHWFIVVLF